MEQVAKLLGVEIGEEFRIQGYDNNVKFKFSDNFFLQSCGTGWHESYSIMRVLEGNGEIIKLPKPILDKAEKKYLKRVIGPWGDEVTSISKVSASYRKKEYIIITTEISGWKHYTELPLFETNSMYKGMELNKEYSLEDLGL